VRQSNLECTCVITRRARNGAVVSATSAIAIVELDARSLIAVCLVGGGVDDVAGKGDRYSGCPSRRSWDLLISPSTVFLRCRALVEEFDRCDGGDY
jgi:hypothetical protein